MKREHHRRWVAAWLTVSALSFVGCSAKSDSVVPPVASTTTGVPQVAPTAPPLVIDDETGVARGPGVPEDPTATTLLTVTTLPPGPTTTMVNNGGPNKSLAEGGSVDPIVASVADEIYKSAIARDYARLSTVIGDRKFRWGFVGQRRPAAQWQKDFAEGKNDQVKRIIALLETSPGIDSNGNTVWPYIAVKDPKEWNAQDEDLALELGFLPVNIIETKLKGRYVDYRLVISAEGIWTGMFLGG
jgi:hypothetical protein